MHTNEKAVVRQIGATGRQSQPDAASRGRTLHRIHRGNGGTRSYDLYVPATSSGRRRPLLVMLHGTGQDSAGFAAGTGMNEHADRHGLLVAYPDQPTSANASKSWNWFQPGDQHSGAGEPALIAGITSEVAVDYRVDPERIYVAGFSAGGAMAAVMAAGYPDLYAGVGVHSGLAHLAADGLVAALAAMYAGGPATSDQHAGGTLPLLLIHGDRDSTVSPINAERLITHRIGMAHPSSVQHHPAVAGRNGDARHGYTVTTYRDPDGGVAVESWIIHNAGHHWAGGRPTGSYTDQAGPDASAELVRFFLQQANRATVAVKRRTL